MINKNLGYFPVVLIIGARQTGKTTLAQMCRPDWKYFDLQNNRDFDFISRDFQFFFSQFYDSVILDEAQELPQLFKELRGVIDKDRSRKNRFILTGSSSPSLLREAADSLAGRIAIVQVSTLKVNEREEKPLPEFYSLFHDEISKDRFLSLKKHVYNYKSDTLKSFFSGGYPEPVLADDPVFHRLWMENYFQSYIERDIRKLFPRLDSLKYRRFIDILSQLSGTIINKASLSRALDISEPSVKDYLDIADSTFIWRKIPSYEKSRSKSIVKMPKGVFRDSGLAHYLAGVKDREDLLRYRQVGFSFEAFITEEILKGMNTLDLGRWEYYYYRTRNGAEIDLILEGGFGTLPIEIKFGSTTKLKQLTSLNRFLEENNLPLGLVINNADEIQPLNEKILQIPAHYI